METIRQKCGTIEDLAGLEELYQLLFERYAQKLGWKKPVSRKLLYFVYRKKESLYTTFQIQKKSKALRTISAPKEPLKRVQKLAAELLTELAPKHPCAHGFLPEKSIVGNASVHFGKKFVLNVDLENFFPSIPAGRIYHALQKGNLKFSPKLAYYLTRFCTLNQGLPQGSPASPILSNLICWNLDNRLRGLADDYDVAYSRYADDLTFSAQHPLPDAFLAKLDEIINSEHFTINAKKVRLQKANVSQEVTGLVVNEKVNLKRGFIKGIRAMLHNWETLGYEEAQNKFIGTYIPKKGKGKAQLSNVVAGKLLYFKMVRGEEDLEYQKYKQQLERLLTGNFNIKAKVVQDIQFPIHHDPRKVVGFLRQFRTVNDSGFRELLHDPGSKDFDFLTNLEKVSEALPGVKKILTPKLFKKLTAFVEVYRKDGVDYFNKTGYLPLNGNRSSLNENSILADNKENYQTQTLGKFWLAMNKVSRRKLWKNGKGVTLIVSGRSMLVNKEIADDLEKTLETIEYTDLILKGYKAVKATDEEGMGRYGFVHPSNIDKVKKHFEDSFPTGKTKFLTLEEIIHFSKNTSDFNFIFPPSKEVTKAANQFRYQIRVGTDFFHDLVLANALKPTFNQLNAYKQSTVKYEPSEEEFGVNCSFFTDSWEVRNAIQFLLKDFALNPAYSNENEKRTIILRSATVQPDPKKKLFCTNIYIQLVEGKSDFEQLKLNKEVRRALKRLNGLADWSILFGKDSKMEQHFLLCSPDVINHKAPYFEGITHKLTFFQS
jgi:RNA-directed DNA polymerase